MKLHWSGATRWHDWFGGARDVPLRMIEGLRRAGVVGEVQWAEVAPDDVREPVPQGDAGGALERLVRAGRKGARSHHFTAGGDRPHAWELTVLLARYLEDRGQVQGYNMLNATFAADPFAGARGSDALLQAFRALHTPDDTEFAMIHPAERWSELSDTLTGAYGDPLTLGPMFRGVGWATFLGPGQLAFFDLDALQELSAHEVRWTGRRDGLFLRVCEDVVDATTPAVEAEMFRLTARFRAALL